MNMSSYTSSWMASNDNFNLYSDTRLERLQTHWIQATTACFSKLSVDIQQSWWTRIKDLHSQPERAYHTLVHLEELLGFLDLLGVDLNHKSYNILVLAIFFHDSIYDVKSATNEEDSAALFQAFCKDMGSDFVDATLESTVSHYILATKQHKVPPQNDDISLILFLDMDMSVLAKDPTAYEVYAGLIRKEYIHVDRAVYCEKRQQVLESFLEEPTIYSSELLRGALEERARTNLQAEIDMLKQGVIPREPT